MKRNRHLPLLALSPREKQSASTRTHAEANGVLFPPLAQMQQLNPLTWDSCGPLALTLGASRCDAPGLQRLTVTDVLSSFYHWCIYPDFIHLSYIPLRI